MEIQVLEQNSNVIVEAFKVDGGAQSLFDRIAEQARSIVFDINNSKDRDAIKSLARKVSSSKTAFDSHGKELKEQYTAITSKIDADRKLFRDQCDALRDEIRKPLTDWEDAKKALDLLINEKVEHVKSFSLYTGEYPSASIQNLIDELNSIEINESFGERKDEAELAKFKGIEALKAQYAIELSREEKEAEIARLAEVERKENERLQAIESDRIQKERDEKIALEAKQKAEREAEEKARIERERVEKEKKDAFEKAEREKREAVEREENLKREAEQALIREAQLKEQAEQQAKQAEIDKALSIERAEQAAKQAEHNKQLAIQAERDRMEREAKDKAEAELKEQQAREANKAHKKAVCDSILTELAKLNIDEATGQNLIKAIYNNQIPNISIKF